MKTMNSKVLGAISALAFFGCAVEDAEVDVEDQEIIADLGADEVIDEIVENLERAGYPDDDIEIREDGTVWVGGDAEVSLGASREMIGLTSRGAPLDDYDGDGDDHFRQYRTTNLVDALVNKICIDGASLSATNGTLSAALNNAIANYNNLALGFTMDRTDGGGGSDCDATITAYATTGTGGSAGFPSGGLPYATFFVGTGVADIYGLNAATHVITHEIGHCIGFRHSDYFNRSISCGSGGNEGAGGVGAVHIPGTPTDAVPNGSVMNSCYNSGSTGVFTSSDVTALETLYPINPQSCEETNACGGQAPGGCWCDAICTSYGDCCFDGPCNSGANPMSCVENNTCGGQAPGGCWCDAVCTSYGDCCTDGPC